MTVFGDVEVSILSELPAGRLPIATHVVGTDQPRLLARAWARVREEVEQGHRVFVVCPRIGGDASVSELEAMWDADEERPTGDGGAPGSSVLDLARSLGEGELAGLRVGHPARAAWPRRRRRTPCGGSPTRTPRAGSTCSCRRR